MNDEAIAVEDAALADLLRFAANAGIDEAVSREVFTQALPMLVQLLATIVAANPGECPNFLTFEYVSGDERSWEVVIRRKGLVSPEERRAYAELMDRRVDALMAESRRVEATQ